MIKIMYLSIGESSPHNDAMQGIREHLDRVFGKDAYTLERSNITPHPDIVPNIVQGYAHQGVDLIVTIGAKITQVASNVTQKGKYPIPVVFHGVTDPVRQKIVLSLERSGGALTGVFMEPLKGILSIQVLLRLCPHLKRTLLLYRTNAQHGRSNIESIDIQYFLQKNRVMAELYPMLSHRADIESLNSAMLRAEAAVALEANLFYEEYAVIAEQIAAPIDTLFYGNGREAISAGALLSVDNDFRLIGKKVGEQIEQILVHKKDPKDVPLIHLDSMRKLLINKRLALIKNLPLTDKLARRLCNSFADQDELETLNTLVVSPSRDVWGHDLQVATTYNMQLENSAHLHYEVGKEWLSGYDLFERDAELYHISSLTHTNAVVVFGEKKARLIHDHFKQHQVKKPIVCIAREYDWVAPENWHVGTKSYGIPMVKVTVPSPNILDMYYMLMAAAPDIEVVIFISGLTEGEMPPIQMNNQVEKIKFFCHKNGKRFQLIRAPSEEYLEHFPLSFLQKGYGIIVCAETLPYSSMRMLGERFAEYNTPAVTGSLTWAPWFPLCIGMDADAIAQEKLMPVLRRLLIEKRSPREHTIQLDYHEWYYAIINEPLAEKMELDIPAVKLATASYKIGTVNHAHDIAICMKQFTSEERLAMLDENERKEGSKEQAVITDDVSSQHEVQC